MEAGAVCRSRAVRVDSCNGMYDVNDVSALLDSYLDLGLVVYVYNCSGRR